MMNQLHGALAASLLCLLITPSADAGRVGVLGDSLSDEYLEGSFGVYAETWTEQLKVHGGVRLGRTASQAGQPGGTWGEPRRTQYEYNWARWAATSGSLISGGQHTGLAAQVPLKAIAHAVVEIGSNDFNPTGAAYFNIYFGLWSQSRINTHINDILTNISTIVDTLQPTGVDIAVTNALDFGVTPTVKALFSDASRRQRVANAIMQLNAGIEQIAQTRQIVLVDLYAAALAVFGPHASPQSTLLIGNVAIDLNGSDTSTGANPTAGFVDDGAHPNTTLHGVFANLIATGLNLGYGAGLPIFTESEILAHRGLAYGGADTLPGQIGAYSDYIRSYSTAAVPGLSFTGVLLLTLLLIGAAALRLGSRA